jgi:pullulanase/glycogen debranching enzyme
MLLGFNVLDLPYYYRTDDDVEHIGPFGNEIKSEERPMVQRWILDQMRHWVDALGVDGFRIDLAGQIDKQTLRRVKRELPQDLIIYGEPGSPRATRTSGRIPTGRGTRRTRRSPTSRTTPATRSRAARST